MGSGKKRIAMSSTMSVVPIAINRAAKLRLLFRGLLMFHWSETGRMLNVSA